MLTLPEKNGKISAESITDYVETFYGDANHEHMVFPGMVYISHPTEYGTLYTKKELEEISEVCHKYDLPLEQLRTIDKRRLKDKVCHLDSVMLDKVNHALEISLELTF